MALAAFFFYETHGFDDRNPNYSDDFVP
jgi:hypothetical protein